MTHRFLLTAFLSATAVAAPAQNSAAPAQAAQPLSRAALQQSIDRAFVTVDTNRDGFTDKAEMEAAQAKAFAARKATALRQREEAFRRMDANKDGSLTLQEYNAALAAAPLPKADVTSVLERFDTNKDGKVSITENRGPAMAQFDRADANKDGVLSAEERRATARR